MTAKGKTEKLREKIAKILALQALGNDGMPTIELVWAWVVKYDFVDEYYNNANEILQICKEAGLRFIPETVVNACGDRPTWFENVEEIEI